MYGNSDAYFSRTWALSYMNPVQNQAFFYKDTYKQAEIKATRFFSTSSSASLAFSSLILIQWNVLKLGVDT